MDRDASWSQRFEADRSTVIRRDEVAERENELRARLIAGESLRDIEVEFDHRDNTMGT